MPRTKPATAVALGALLLISAGCHRGAEHAVKAPPSPEVRAAVAEVGLTEVAAPYEAVGTVRSETAGAIQSKVVGQVTAVHVKEGDRVEAGGLLVEIDDREAQAQLQQAESGLREAQQARNEVDRGIEAAAHAKAAADANRDLAVATFERYKGLADNKAVSRQVFDEAEAKAKAAAAEAARAAEMHAAAQAKAAEVGARIAQAQAAVDNARVFVSHTRIEAPFGGIITHKSVDVGDLAAPGSVLLTLENPSRYQLHAIVDEAHVERIKAGDAVPVVLDALPDGTLSGVVAEVVPAADPASRTFVVKVNLPDRAGIASGLFGRARFSYEQSRAVTVPASAVVRRGQLTGVYVVSSDGGARLRLVTTGKRYGEQLEILSGLDPGDRIVTSNLEQVTDGAVIRQP